MTRAEQISNLKRTLTAEQCGMHAGLFADYLNGHPIAWERVKQLIGESVEPRLALTPAKTERDDQLAVLGLEAPVTQEQIKRAYRDLARKHHPDHGGDAVRMKTINAAYAALTRR